MTIAELGLALAVLLLTPGPTNTLMLMAGAERGPGGAVRLIAVEVAAYLAVIAPLALLAQGIPAHLEVVRPVVALLAGLWVLYLAWSMWGQSPGEAARGTVSARRLGVTTLLNPKGLIMGLVLLPAAGATPAAFGMLVLCIVMVAALWAGIGCHLPGSGRALPPLWRRAASVWLAGLAVFIVAGGIAT
jgi:threonine/homoserine/homoserine lactone efflux protein